MKEVKNMEQLSNRMPARVSEQYGSFNWGRVESSEALQRPMGGAANLGSRQIVDQSF
jgi:hypothetical protein